MVVGALLFSEGTASDSHAVFFALQVKPRAESDQLASLSHVRGTANAQRALLARSNRALFMGLGARCGLLTDAHQVDYLSIRSAAFVDSASVPVAVANNGQQLSSSSRRYGRTQPL